MLQSSGGVIMHNYFVINLVNVEDPILFDVISITFFKDRIYFQTDDSESYDFLLSDVRSFRFVPVSSEG